MQALASIAAAFTGSGTPLQGGSATAAGAASVAFSFTSPNTAGSTLIAFVGIFGTTPSGASTISDTLGHTWTLISDSTETSPKCEVAMWYCFSASGGTNVVTVSNNAGLDYDLQVWEYPSTLTALDVWGGGDDSYTFVTDTQTVYSDATGNAIVTSANDVVIVGVYNPQGSGLSFSLNAPAKPALPSGTWNLRNQSHNSAGETSALFDGAIPNGTAMWITAAMPAPVFPLGGLSGQGAVKIQSNYFHPTNNYQHNYMEYPANCGPFEHSGNLYVALMGYAAGGSPRPVDMFKSGDQGVTWAKVGTTPVLTDPNTRVSPCARFGTKIYVLWVATGGLVISAFDMTTDSWIGSTAPAPGTGGIPATGYAAYDFAVPAADVFIVWYNTPLTGTPNTTNLIINRYSGGVWSAATTFAAVSVLCGLTFDPATATAHVLFTNFTATFSPRTLYLSEVTNFTWPFTGPTPVVVQASIPQATANVFFYRMPVFGPVASFGGKLYIPYGKQFLTGGNPSGTIPACYVGTPATGFSSVDLTPYTAQGYTRFDGWGTAASTIWATVVGSSLYIYWAEAPLGGSGPPARIRYCVSSDGTLPAPVSTFFDAVLNMPASLQGLIDTVTPLHTLVWSLSVGVIFGSRIGIVCNMQDPTNGPSNEAWFLPMIEEPTPPVGGGGVNSGYTSAAGAAPLQINATGTWYPQLEGLGLPRALVSAIGQAYAMIYSLRDAMRRSKQ